MKRPAWRSMVRWGIAAVLLLLVVGVGLVVSRVVDAIGAEERLQGVRLVCELAGTAVEQEHGKRWPRSWAELEAITPRAGGRQTWEAFFTWPRDAEKVKALIEVDWKADIGVLRAQTGETFEAIRPRGRHANYPFTPEYEELIGRVRGAGG